MKKLTRADRKKKYGIKNITELDKNTIAAVFRNINYYFNSGITFPMVGIPTFSLNSNSVFDHGGNCLFVRKDLASFFSREFLLGILCSKFMTYVIKNFINNTVNTEVNDIKKCPIPVCEDNYKNKIERLVKTIIKKQKEDASYPYHKDEQIELDDLINEIFGLDNERIVEVNNWYDRKYPYLRRN